jgi:RNA polymerase sigma-70 factor (ECF subfamily)
VAVSNRDRPPTLPTMPAPLPSEDLAAVDDAELMRRVAAGRDGALAELVDRYSAALTSLAGRILGNSADAEEVALEAFVHAWRRADRYDPGRSSVSTWLVLIARSRAIDRLRSRRVAERATEAARLEAAADESPRAARNVFVVERRRRVAAAMHELPAEQRRVLELAYYQGLTQTEIAARTGTPLGTVKTRTLLAMNKLREALRGEIGELL